MPEDSFGKIGDGCEGVKAACSFLRKQARSTGPGEQSAYGTTGRTRGKAQVILKVDNIQRARRALRSR